MRQAVRWKTCLMNARLVIVEETGSGRAMATMLGALKKACQPGTTPPPTLSLDGPLIRIYNSLFGGVVP